MTRRHGFDLLADQVADWLANEWDCIKDEKKEHGGLIGNSPIEKLLFTALKTSCQLGFREFAEVLLVESEAEVGKSKYASPCGFSLYVWPQAPIERRLVDFLIFAPDHKSELVPHPWRKLIVECDGHDFHERTKSQAAKDRSKDRAALLSGYDFFRFTGSEIWGDPIGCADQIFDWACKGIF